MGETREWDEVWCEPSFVTKLYWCFQTHLLYSRLKIQYIFKHFNNETRKTMHSCVRPKNRGRFRLCAWGTHKYLAKAYLYVKETQIKVAKSVPSHEAKSGKPCRSGAFFRKPTTPHHRTRKLMGTWPNRRFTAVFSRIVDTLPMALPNSEKPYQCIAVGQESVENFNQTVASPSFLQKLRELRLWANDTEGNLTKAYF